MREIKNHVQAEKCFFTGIKGEDIVRVIQKPFGNINIELKNGQMIQIKYDGPIGIHVIGKPNEN